VTDAWRKKMDSIRRSGFNPLLRILSIVVLGVLLVSFYRIYKFIWPTPYVAGQYGFQIVFSGNPTITKLPSQKNSGVEGGAIYSVDDQIKGTDYAVYVTNYSHADFDSLSRNSKIEVLEGEVEAISKHDQLSLTSGQVITFDNLTAVEATIAAPTHSGPDTHLIAFFNKSRLYILLGAGITASKFNSYTKTFRFTD
jgi:hypothetical protein